MCAGLASFTPPTRSADARLRQQVVEQIARTPEAKNVDVRISGGVATVTGEIRDASEGRRVLELIGGIPGVMDTLDQLRIDDDVICGAVRKALRADPFVRDVPVSVRCDMGEVTLTSNQTSADQRSRMGRIAGTVQDVVHVVDDMR